MEKKNEFEKSGVFRLPKQITEVPPFVIPAEAGIQSFCLLQHFSGPRRNAWVTAVSTPSIFEFTM